LVGVKKNRGTAPFARRAASMLGYRPQKTRKQLRPRYSAGTIHIAPRLYFHASSREEISQASSSWIV